MESSSLLDSEKIDKILSKYSTEDTIVRRVTEGDMNEEYISLLKQLTTSVFTTKETITKFYRDHIKDNKMLFHLCIVEKSLGSDGEGKYLALGNISIQPKLTRGLSFMSMIEDIVVDRSARGKGLGKVIVDCLTEVSFAMGCYKVLLYCDEKLVPFYNKSGYESNSVLMRIDRKDEGKQEE